MVIPWKPTAKVDEASAVTSASAAARQLTAQLCLALVTASAIAGSACSDQAPPPAGAGGSATLTGGAAGDAAGGLGAAGATGGSPTAGSGGQAAGSGGAGGLGFDGPLLLSETGLYADLQRGQLSPDVLAYQVQYPLWSDGAEERRYLLLPAGARIDTEAMDSWVFPDGTTAWKEQERDGVRVSTLMLRKRAEGWQFVAYVWREDLSDAEAAPAGLSDARGTPLDVPSQAQCIECHAAKSSFLGSETNLRFLGLSAIQLSQPGGGALTELADSDRLTHAPGREFAAPGDADVAAGLGYLHGNCGSCHSASHPLGSKLGMALELSSGQQTLEQTGFYSTTIGHGTRHIVAGTSVVVQPGDPAASQLYVRMGIRDLEQMPPLGTEVVDVTGRGAVARLILALPPP